MIRFKKKEDCFAYDKTKRDCKALNDLYCSFEECPFYKTEFQRCTECRTSRTQITCKECKEKGLK